MADNYSKIMESMQSRFGREDLQIEVYIRELQKLILSKSASKQKIDISKLYDSIETQLRALETLGITPDKCSAMLFPIIESCLPQELLRIWQRSTNIDCRDGTLENRLKLLMTFLRNEVENEQRIALAAEGFGLSEEVASSSKTSVKGSSGFPTAANLINCEISACVFCSGTHGSEDCFKAQKITFVQKRDVLIEKKACFRCLKIGHRTKRCKTRLRCVICSQAHVVLMCPSLTISQGKHSNSQNENMSSKDVIHDQALTNQTKGHVFLQTLRVTLTGIFGNSRVVRALIDSGS
ncbi:uncharacterized protein [Diabrotica undecimpunctata]|uniref:uncharacterized protein n=1 Tax=Diabrotica undecimpunctata TaxID=50387 RepID=UPI003B642328